MTSMSLPLTGCGGSALGDQGGEDKHTLTRQSASTASAMGTTPSLRRRALHFCVPLVKSSVQRRLFVTTKESRERMVEWRGRSVAVAVMAMAVLGLVVVVLSCVNKRDASGSSPAATTDL